jgi:hypothetical protein
MAIMLTVLIVFIYVDENMENKLLEDKITLNKMSLITKDKNTSVATLQENLRKKESKYVEEMKSSLLLEGKSPITLTKEEIAKITLEVNTKSSIRLTEEEIAKITLEVNAKSHIDLSKE